MGEFFEAAFAVWPWWSGPLLAAWWVALVEAAQKADSDDGLGPSRGCVFALTLMGTVVWVIGFLVWLVRLS